MSKRFVSAYLPDWEDKERNLRAFVKILVENGVAGKGMEFSLTL
ncbi:hypothetical protein [Nostoc sp. ChiSLP03a]|nr:hypothetical protein [Nostoc sp. ChiSLP03a]MDZ8210449.1 hypothetical protein [Nostoc sp. ChiSLP03a]